MKLHRDLVLEAFKNNVCFYDAYSNTGKISINLIRIINGYHFSETNKGRVDRIFIPHEDIKDLVNQFDKTYNYSQETVRIFGMQITPNYHEYDLADLYERHGGTFPANKYKLLICQTDKNYVLCGAY